MFSCLGGHTFTGLRTFPAGSDAFVHALKATTVLRTLATHRGAGSTDFHMKRRTSHEKLRACLADFRAQEHQSEVIRRDVLAAHFEAMSGRHREAHAMTSDTVFKAVGNFRGWSIHGLSVFYKSPPGTDAAGLFQTTALLFRRDSRFTRVSPQMIFHRIDPKQLEITA